MYPGMFNKYPDRSGRRWLRNVRREDRKVFGKAGRMAADAKLGDGGLSSLGGKARAASAERDSFGRFFSADTKTRVYYWRDEVILYKGEPFGEHLLGEIAAIHSYGCIARSVKSAFARWAWSQKWHNACPDCEGHGYTRGGEDPCPTCVERGCCPRCGEQAWREDDFQNAGPRGVTCPFCDWNEASALEYGAEQAGLVMPAEMECWCWEAL